MEYVFILALILGFVIALMIGGMREGELNLAVGAARSASLEWTAENSSVYLTSLAIAQNGRSVNFTPVLYYWSGAPGGGAGGRLKPLPALLVARAITAVQRSTAPASPPPSGNCFSSVNYDYCVVDSTS